MSYILRIVVPALPEKNALAWEVAQSICDEEDDDAPPAAVLVKLHRVLTRVYPCMSSYRGDDPAIEDCPWSDAPLINNFSSASAVLGLTASKALDDVRSLIVSVSLPLGLTVLNEQTGEIHRPFISDPDNTYRIMVNGILPGFDRDKVMADVGREFKASDELLLEIFSSRAFKVKGGLNLLTAQIYQATLNKLGCKCNYGPEKRL